MAKKLEIAVQETQEWMQLNVDVDATGNDAYESLLQDCGQMDDGTCLQAGSEYCDWDCPFSN